MAIRHGIVASSVGLLPTVSLSAASNFNESIATLNSVVSANGFSTTVKFQYSTSSVFSSFTEVNAATTPITGQSVSSYANITGLSVNTTYYFRCVATNDIGTTTSSSLSFVTWSLKTYANGTAGSYTLTIPTVTPTGGSAVIPSIYDVFILGGGGGGNARAGGGGGGYRLVSSRAFTSTSNNILSLSVGDGGSAGGGGSGGAGGSTSITASNFTSISAGGGGGSTYPAPTGPASTAVTGNPKGGDVGTGDNTAYTGGNGVASYDKNGNLDGISTGGGGGAGVGGNGSSAPNSTSTGGNGGAGRTEYGYSGGAGGYGQGPTGTGTQGTPRGYGDGGNSPNAGVAGLIYFKYYGP